MGFVASLDRRALRLLPLAMTIFCCASGGPFGLEPVMQAGPGLALVLILVMPLIWAVPAALMTAELASALPEEGGYYVWVRRAFGAFGGFLCGWWTWIYTCVDAALYPVLFATFISKLLETFGYAAIEDPWIKWGVGMAMVVPLTWLNVRGTRLVGFSTVVFAVLFLAPFAVVVALGLPHLFANPSAMTHPFSAAGKPLSEAISVGLYTIMWNYLGWDSLSTVAGEVENPQRSYPRALLIAVSLTVAVYLLPTMVGAVLRPDYANWGDGTWVEVARAAGGQGLAIAMIVAGVFSASALFSSTLLGASRVPFVLAEHKLLPGAFSRLHPKYGTPWMAILASAVVYSALSYKSFSSLVAIDVIVYAAGLLLEFAALVALRRREPALERPYKIPGGWPGLALVVLLPTALTVFAIVDSVFFDSEYGARSAIMAAIALATGPVVYFLNRWGYLRSTK